VVNVDELQIGGSLGPQSANVTGDVYFRRQAAVWRARRRAGFWSLNEEK